VLVVEDDARQLDSIRQLLAGENINLVGVRTATGRWRACARPPSTAW
jgi:PleD family two-component response regulator